MYVYMYLYVSKYVCMYAPVSGEVECPVRLAVVENDNTILGVVADLLTYNQPTTEKSDERRGL